MIMHIAVRGFIRGVRQFEEFLEIDDDKPDELEALSESNARRILALPGGERHMMEIEFLDEPEDGERFFRFGTESAGIVMPIEIDMRRGSN